MLFHELVVQFFFIPHVAAQLGNDGLEPFFHLRPPLSQLCPLFLCKGIFPCRFLPLWRPGFTPSCRHLSNVAIWRCPISTGSLSPSGFAGFFWCGHLSFELFNVPIVFRTQCRASSHTSSSHTCSHIVTNVPTLAAKILHPYSVPYLWSQDCWCRQLAITRCMIRFPTAKAPHLSRARSCCCHIRRATTSASTRRVFRHMLRWIVLLTGSDLLFLAPTQHTLMSLLTRVGNGTLVGPVVCISVCPLTRPAWFWRGV